MALGFDKAPPGLNKPRPLKQPILNRLQWARIVFIGILTAIVTVYLENLYQAESVPLRSDNGFCRLWFNEHRNGPDTRSEAPSAFNRDIFP